MEQSGPARRATHHRRNAGDQWLAAGKTALLEVSSALIPSETNFILNPLHPDMAKLRIGAARAFYFDPRMWK